MSYIVIQYNFLLVVVVDRKYDKNCDIGRFELAYKQPLVTVPPYVGISLSVDGQAIRKPGGFVRRSIDNEQFFSPRKQVLTDKSHDSNKVNNGQSKRPHSDNQENNHKHTTNSAPAKPGKSNSTGEQNKAQTKSSRYHGSKSKSPTTTTGGNNTASNSGSNTSNTSSSDSTNTSSNKENQPTSGDSSHGRGSHGNNSAGGGSGSGGGGGGNSSSGTSLSSSHPKPEKSVSLPMAASLCTTATLSTCSGNFPTADSLPSTAHYLASIPGKKMVSKTSVSTNYTIPNVSDKQDKPKLIVNNVESTDLGTIRPSASTSNSSLTKGNSNNNNEVNMLYKLSCFPASSTKPPRTHKRMRANRPLGLQARRNKDYLKRPEVLIKLPKVPYASIDVTISGLSPKLKYFNTNKPDDGMYHPNLSVFPLTGT